MALPTLADVSAAAARLAGIVNYTPVLTSRTLDEATGSHVFVKCENLQRAGAFKFRGAYNAIAKLSPADRARGILTFSSGNHAQAVALVGRLLHVPVTVVMPENAPVAKLQATRGYGAEVVLYAPEEAHREELAAKLQAERNMILIPPFDHPDIVAGQGTAALELLKEVGRLDLLLAPCGGGGLLGGTALAATSTATCKVIGVEPRGADDATRSFHTGSLQRLDHPQTIADGLRTPSLGNVTFPLIRAHVTDMVTVSEEEIVEAMRFCWTRMKLVVEPSGAVSVAGLLFRSELHGKGRVGVIVSGGNVDLSVACELLAPM